LPKIRAWLKVGAIFFTPRVLYRKRLALSSTFS